MTWEWLALVALLHTAHGANILAIFPIPAKSHNIAFSALTEELANRGHHVTAISSFPLKSPPQDYTDIQVKMTLAEGEFNPFLHGKMSLFHESTIVWEEGWKTCELFLKHTEVQQLIHSNSHHFDAIILEAFANECFLGFAHKYKAPIIQICPFGGTHWMGNWVGNPNPFSYVPHPFGESTHEMSLWERLENTLVGLYWTLGVEYYSLPQQEAVMRKYFAGSEPLPPLSELLRNTSLLLVNNHFSLSYPKPLVPNLVQVGGLHVKAPKKLSQDLQTYLDEAKDGVIYFSMGSILKGFQLPDAKRKAFLEAFSKLKQKVLWKWEADSLPGQPSNVKLGKWLPQSDILAHRNVKLFVTHGGLLGMQEAMTHGVPLLGIPMYGDQSYNMKKAVEEGYGVLLEFGNITTQSLTWALESVLQPSYRKNAQRISRIFRDQPLTPLETAVFWTEYVIRHKGAPHMRSAALDLSWYQYYLLDVIAVLTLAVVIATSVPVLIIRWLFRKCSDNSKKKKD